MANFATPFCKPDRIMTSTDTIRIDLDAVLRQRIPRYRRWIPDAVVRGLECFIRQDELNQLMSNNYRYKDAEFCRGVLHDLNATYRVVHPELLPPADDSRVIFVCNHPLGALDGIVIIDLISKTYGPGAKFVVNDLLSVLTPLKETFLPINKHGRQSRRASMDLDEAFKSQVPIIMFPAGLVSRRQKNGEISDLKWNKMFISRAIRDHRDIVPLHFDGHNSNFFYKFAQLRERLGIKLNIEMICLPREVFGCRDKEFTVTVGRRIPWQELASGGRSAADEAQRIRSIIYSID